VQDVAEIIPFPTERARPPGSPPPALKAPVRLAAVLLDLTYLPDGQEGWGGNSADPVFDFTGLQGDRV
jgi:hypothetical protein